MPAQAGRKIRIKTSGAAIAFTDEACTNSGDNLTYQITNAAKRVWDRAATITVKKDTVVQSATLYTLNRLSGKITFGVSQGAGVITVSGSYLPMSLVAEARSWRLAFLGNNAEETEFIDDDVVRKQVRQDVNGQLGRWWIDTYFHDHMQAADPVPFVAEMFLDGGTTPTAKAWIILGTRGVSGQQAGLVEEMIDFEGAADVDGRSFTFSI